MFADAFWPNLSLFVLGQAVAWIYLRTGRVLRGAALMAALLILADLALVARFVLAAPATAAAAIWLMQVYVLVEAGLLSWAGWRRRRPDARSRRAAAYRAALVADLRGDDPAALAGYRRLRRTDPWDLAATIGWAAASRRLGRPRRARWLLWQAAALDRRGQMRDLVALERRRAAAAGVIAPVPRLRPPPDARRSKTVVRLRAASGPR